MCVYSCAMLLRLLRMSAPVFRQATLVSTIKSVTSLPWFAQPVLNRGFHMFQTDVPRILTSASSAFYTPNAGYKVRVKLRKRCEECYFVSRKGRLFVECKAKPRHKQMLKMNKKSLFRED